MELEANTNLSLTLCYPQQPHPHHHLPSHSSQPPAAARAGEARSWPLLHQLTDICQTLFPLLFWPRFQPQSGKSHLIWAPLLRKIITEKISLVFWQLSQQGRKNNSRLGSWRCGNIRTHFLYANLSLTGQQMQMPTEKRSTDLERRWLACTLLVPMEKQTTLLTAAPVH